MDSEKIQAQCNTTEHNQNDLCDCMSPAPRQNENGQRFTDEHFIYIEPLEQRNKGNEYEVNMKERNEGSKDRQ